MTEETARVDGFKFLPPKLSAWIRTFIPESGYTGDIPFQPLSKPLKAARIAAVTSAGIRLKSDTPFDMEREKEEPTWGDPTYRALPVDTTEGEIDVNHLHINKQPILEDINVMLPLARLRELAEEGIIGEAAPTHYSFYGFQWDESPFLEEGIRPILERMKAESVDGAFLTPA